MISVGCFFSLSLSYSLGLGYFLGLRGGSVLGVYIWMGWSTWMPAVNRSHTEFLRFVKSGLDARGQLGGWKWKFASEVLSWQLRVSSLGLSRACS